MANGRMISQAITKDLRINQLSDDTSRLAFTWLITFADREGRTYGDPAIVRSMLFPRREDITIAKMTEYIQEWYELRLIVWYEAGGDRFIFFPAFEKNQRGMRPERESPSIIPQQPGISPQPHQDDSEQTPDELRSNDGVTPDEGRNKLSQVKLSQVKSIADADIDFIPATDGLAGEIYRQFENEICLLTPILSEKIGGWIDTYPPDWIKDAIKAAVDNNVRKPNYIDKILSNWKTEGRNGTGKPKIDSKVYTEVH